VQKGKGYKKLADPIFNSKEVLNQARKHKKTTHCRKTQNASQKNIRNTVILHWLRSGPSSSNRWRWSWADVRRKGRMCSRMVSSTLSGDQTLWQICMPQKKL